MTCNLFDFCAQYVRGATDGTSAEHRSSTGEGAETVGIGRALSADHDFVHGDSERVGRDLG